MMEHGHMDKGPGGLDADAGSGRRRERNPLPGPPRPIPFRTLDFFEPKMHGWTYERSRKLWHHKELDRPTFQNQKALYDHLLETNMMAPDPSGGGPSRKVQSDTNLDFDVH